MVEYAKKNLASYSGLTRVSFGEKKQNNKSEHYNTGLQNFDNKRIIGAMPENDSQEYAFEKLNAKFIEESKFINKTDLIVTE
ncbi:MAG: hypothetical protein LBD88_05365 [Candidatus Peribacteria bacterium]|jgi:hypothetical protein|nr:hypothetical protein [Candidatus Peribacteria bacterium]